MPHSSDVFMFLNACYDRVVKGRFLMLRKVPLMNFLKNVSCDYHGLLFIQDNQKMCNVG